MKKWAFISLVGIMLLVFNFVTTFVYGIAKWQLPSWDIVPALLRLTFAEFCAFTVLYLTIIGLVDWAKGKK
ncbi:hypothetical protein [Xenorhabdus lircayensis]|uniref:Uncharacterized protein n=1 Tax=Xenorhabdus lircayensis TaxID=2763499 RepID=A0ABS0UA05_9GAMM|nr:hypothetical protein [Xenorhabdus lircayensis]MBI6550714.1 hypothetical protein [Xenorhabdus lircayensis]